MNKLFDLEAFKAGQKALTRDGRIATYVGFCKECDFNFKVMVHIENDGRCFPYKADGVFFNINDKMDLVSMVSRHQHLIDSYNPEDTWQIKMGDVWCVIYEPKWYEACEYRLHPHNDLIKAHKKGAKIECKYEGKEWRDASSDDIWSWYEDAEYRIKPESTTHCLCYNPGHVHGEFSWSPSLATKELAVANGWKIIQEWEV